MSATAVRSAVSPLRIALVLTALLGGCGDSSGPNQDSNLFFGVLASSSGVGSGDLTLRIADDKSGGSGGFTVNGTEYSISSLVVTGDQVTATGGGYTFVGTLTASDVSGTWTTAADQGIFTIVLRPGSQSAIAYCGSHIGTLNGGQPTGGAFMVVTSGGALRGLITSAGGPALESVITGSGTDVFTDLSGDADINVATDDFQATYSDNAGDAGDAAGHVCGASGPAAVQFTGVIGDFAGTSGGSIDLDLGDASVTSGGTFTVNGSPTTFDAVIMGVSNKVVAFAGIQVFSGTINGTSLDGEWWNANTQTGLMAATEDAGNVVLYCGTHDAAQGSGIFSFAYVGGNVIHGVFTGGVGSAFQGLIGGVANGVGTMTGQTGDVTVLPDPTTFGGFFDFTGASGITGSVSGVVCP